MGFMTAYAVIPLFFNIVAGIDRYRGREIAL
jgi:hypothetical protein